MENSYYVALERFRFILLVYLFIINFLFICSSDHYLLIRSLTAHQIINCSSNIIIMLSVKDHCGNLDNRRATRMPPPIGFSSNLDGSGLNISHRHYLWRKSARNVNYSKLISLLFHPPWKHTCLFRNEPVFWSQAFFLQMWCSKHVLYLKE